MTQTSCEGKAYTHAPAEARWSVWSAHRFGRGRLSLPLGDASAECAVEGSVGALVLLTLRTSWLVTLLTVSCGSDILWPCMKPANKIAVGVIALAIVVTVMMKGPSWQKRARERHQENILAGLTPEQAVALCGRPVLDETQSGRATVTRRLVIRNDYALAVELDFAATASEPQKWRLTGVQDPSGEIKYQSPAAQIGVLPCLDGKQVKKSVQKLQ